MNVKDIKRLIIKMDPVSKKKYLYFPAVIAIIAVVVMISGFSAAAVLNLTTQTGTQSAYQFNTSSNTDFTSAPLLNNSFVPASFNSATYTESSTTTTAQTIIFAVGGSSSVTPTAGDFAERLNFTGASSITTGTVNFTVFDSYTVTSSGATTTYTGHSTVSLVIKNTEAVDVLIYIDFGTTTPPTTINYISVIVSGA